MMKNETEILNKLTEIVKLKIELIKLVFPVLDQQMPKTESENKVKKVNID